MLIVKDIKKNFNFVRIKSYYLNLFIIYLFITHILL